MPSFLSNLLEQTRGIWNNLTLGRKVALVLVGIAILAGLIALIFLPNRVEYRELYSNLSSDDRTNVEIELDNMGIPYQTSEDGKTILVPQGQIRQARMRLANKGLPRSESTGFELFDETRFGMTDFAQHIQYQRALQGELANTITQMDKVSDARVHLVIPQPSVFIEEEKPAKASILLTIAPGEQLNKNQINGIIHLVASAVEGLKEEDVELIDTAKGVLLKEKKSLAESVSEQLKYRHAVEESYRNRILSALSPVVGPGKLTAWVSVDMNFDSFEVTKEEYEPYNVIQNEQMTTETTERLAKIVGGTPGMSSNANVNTTPTTQSPPGPSQQPQSNILQNQIPLKETKEESTVSYVVGKSMLKTKRVPGHIERITASVVVDNKQKAGIKQPQPWTKAKLQEIESIVKGTIGYNSTRGDVVEVKNVPFAISQLPKKKEVAPEVAQRRNLYRTLAQLAFGLIVIVFAYFMILRPIFRGIGKLTPVPEAEKPEEIPTEVEEEKKPEELIEEVIPEAAISTKESAGLEALRNLAEESPEKIEGLILHWLEED